MRIFAHKLGAWMKRLGAQVKKSGFSLALTGCLVLIGGAAWYARGVDQSPAPKLPSVTVSPVIMTPAQVETLDEAVKRESEELIWPVSGKEIISPYSGDEPIYNETLNLWSWHTGVDILAAPGEAVLAATDGSVTALFKDQMLGYTIEIKRDDGLVTRYSNLTSLNGILAGEKITRGQVIGSVGSSADGESKLKPHLHYEAYLNGEWYLSGRQ